MKITQKTKKNKENRITINENHTKNKKIKENHWKSKTIK